MLNTQELHTLVNFLQRVQISPQEIPVFQSLMQRLAEENEQAMRAEQAQAIRQNPVGQGQSAVQPLRPERGGGPEPEPDTP